MRKLAVLVATIAALIIAPAAANAAITNVLNGDLTCGVVTAEGNVTTSIGQRWCGSQPASITSTLDVALPATRSTHKTFDGVPLDVNVAFPPAAGPDTDWPVVGIYHGYGGSKASFGSMQRWLDKGYAVFSLTNRGSGESCKNAGSIAADPTGCANGYVHLMDPRFEIRDAQNFLGELVDEGVINPTKIAATGGSYGGSESMHLGVLKDRVTNLDGTLSTWESPLGERMSIAVASPNIPWTDLIQALGPNGDTYDYLKDGSFTGNVGIMKESYVNGLYISARNADAGTDPMADVAGWKNLLDAGEPYGTPAGQAMVAEITQHHSVYYGGFGQAPAPLLMSSGFTDDLFPVDEVIRYYNRTRAEYPNTPMSIFAGSFGHPRGQSQANVSSALSTLEESWIDYYMKGIGSQPASNVVAYTQTCPNGTPGGGPYSANDWASLAPGEIKLTDTGGPQTIAADGGIPASSSAFNPIPAGAACTTASDAVEPGSAYYDMAPAPAGGYTVLGMATVLAKISGADVDSQIAARLVDLDGAGNKTLIERGSWRPASSGFQVFQLHPGAWKVEAGHTVRLELLPKDASAAAGSLFGNFSRPSNNQQAMTVDKLELRVPVVEAPGALGGLVTAPATKVLPDRDGAELAPGYSAIGSESIIDYGKRVDPIIGNLKVVGKAKVKGKRLKAKVKCDGSNDSCAKATIKFEGTGKNKGLIAKKGGLKVAAGKTKTVTFLLSNRGRKIFKNKKKLRAKVEVNGKNRGKVTTKRVGRVR